MQQLRQLRKVELVKVAEVIDRSSWLSKTLTKTFDKSALQSLEQRLGASKLADKDLKTALKGGLLTYLLHCEARIASYLGKGFYTIGPCGEELLGLTSLHLSEKDVMALHYRHVANSVVRQLQAGTAVDQIALNRARGFTCSVNDPVTGGRHCSIGGNHRNEFIVTSTLSSQATPALGRALAIPYAHQLIGEQANFAPDAISYVSLGDGSVSNAHFLSALTMARYSAHSRLKCPLLFVVSDNNISISLKSNGFVETFMGQLQGIQTEMADGSDFLDLHAKAGNLVDYIRTYRRPALLYVKNLPRRFGHAATDRQFAYYTEKEIANQTARDPLSDTFAMLTALGVYQAKEVEDMFASLQDQVTNAFDLAVEEPKISSREALIASNSLPIYTRPKAAKAAAKDSGRPEVMRKQMTRVFDEILDADRRVVYLGEDVRHGGYYLVTDGLAAKYPQRVLDFPPDETSLVGIGMGMAQAGLVPIVEIPYAKYLDCGLDIFYEAIISSWLSNGQQPTGLLLRLQGFDRGIFGGNYHTHNMISCQAPGLDVLCFSNGRDYVRGLRFAMDQVAHAKRVVMVVDSTDLLNRRHLDDSKKDEAMLRTYPGEDEPYDFDQVMLYPDSKPSKTKKQIVLVSYGNGIPTSLQAQAALKEAYAGHDVVVIDTPCISQTPAQLKKYLQDNHKNIDAVVFADVCKYTPAMPLAKMAVDLQNDGLYEKKGHAIKWKVIGAAPTYNPLGSYLTFLSVQDINNAVKALM